MGELNCHNEAWEYADTNNDEEAVEKWAGDNELSLIHDPKLPHSFDSRGDTTQIFYS